MKRRLFCSALALCAVVLSGCGFHLRGSGPNANLPFKTMYLNASPSSPVAIELRRYLESSGTAITSEAKSAEAILDVLSEVREKTILSRNSQGRVREYTLGYKVGIRVRDNQNAQLLAPTVITITRTISFNESQVLAKEAEEGMLYRDMQTDLVQQVLRRLAAIKPVQNQSPAETPKPDTSPGPNQTSGNPAR